MRKLILE